MMKRNTHPKGYERGAIGVDDDRTTTSSRIPAATPTMTSVRRWYKQDPRDISTEEFKRACDPWSLDTWAPGAIKGQGGTRKATPVVGTGPVDAYSKTYKGAAEELRQTECG